VKRIRLRFRSRSPSSRAPIAIHTKLEPVPGDLIFRCNICGTIGLLQLDRLLRETVSCSGCASTPRARAVIDLLTRELTGQRLSLPDLAPRADIRGLGLSDSDNCASRLEKKFAYHNTYFHREPYLDIAGEIPPDQMAAYDFVISSEVFEHVLPPIDRAFANVFKLLKPGGLLLLTVPYGMQPETIEHFPDLYDFTITETSGCYQLINRTRQGVIQKFDHLKFHGGPGTTLEMRLFAEADLLRRLRVAGFIDVRIRRDICFEYGIWWEQPWSWPLSARRPKCQK